MDFVKINQIKKISNVKSKEYKDSSSSSAESDYSVSSYYSSDENTDDERIQPIKINTINELKIEQLKIENLALTIQNAKLAKEKANNEQIIKLFEKLIKNENIESIQQIDTIQNELIRNYLKQQFKNNHLNIILPIIFYIFIIVIIPIISSKIF